MDFYKKMIILIYKTMIVELIVGISSFVGGILMTGSIYKMVNYWRERRDIERRTMALYDSFVNDDNFSINNDSNY